MEPHLTEISARTVLHSISPEGHELLTVEYTAPRFILAEINTHRVKSRNARSSRAVPSRTLFAEVQECPVIPIDWGANRPGMQATESIPSGNIAQAEAIWLEARDAALRSAEALAALGIHKQVVNRVIEPFMWARGLISATEWNNFFALRCHPDADPHMELLAEKIREAKASSIPQRLKPGEWHLPYVLPGDREAVLTQIARTGTYGSLGSTADEALRLISVARCARVSFKAFDTGEANPRRDYERGVERLQSRPLHASPFEQIATPDDWVSKAKWDGEIIVSWRHPAEHGNYVGWRQWRRMLPGHYVAG